MRLTISFVLLALVPIFVNQVILELNSRSALRPRPTTTEPVGLAVNPDKFPSYLFSIQNYVADTARLSSTLDALNEFSSRFGDLHDELSISARTKQLKEIHRFYAETFANEYRLKNGESVQIDQFISRLDAPSVPAQYDFIVRNEHPLGKKQELVRPHRSTAYGEAHEKFHPIYQGILDSHGLYDVFLINENGRVVYSVFKEIDFATSLITGPWSSTGLGNAFRAARRIKPDSHGIRTHFEDFSSYVPSYDAPAAFVSAPLYSDGKFAGALIVQIPLEKVVRSHQLHRQRFAQLSL